MCRYKRLISKFNLALIFFIKNNYWSQAWPLYTSLGLLFLSLGLPHELWSNIPTKQKNFKRWYEDQNQLSNRLFWRSLLTSIFTLADGPKVWSNIKNFKRWILANCVESFLMTLHSQLISIFWNS
jgi:hypothetical protein